MKFNWRKLRLLFTASGKDRFINARRPWWLMVGRYYYIHGLHGVQWYMRSIGPLGAVMSCSAHREHNTQVFGLDLVLARPV